VQNAAPVVRRAPMTGRRRLRDIHIHDHFGTLFALLLGAFIVAGFADFRWARVIAGVLQLIMLVVAFFSTRMRGRFPITVLLGVVVFVTVALAIIFHDDSHISHGFSGLMVAGVYAALLAAVFRRVLAQRTVTMETILGALSVYFLVGLLFTALFASIDVFSVDPIFGRDVPNSDYSYFSFITLTTVGYGDVTAVTDVARRFAVVEAMAGQIFLATAVARLVSLYGLELRPSRGSAPAGPSATESPAGIESTVTAAVDASATTRSGGVKPEAPNVPGGPGGSRTPGHDLSGGPFSR